jgi:hypothetical protein
MVMVRSLREHSNAYGDSAKKAEGKEYDLPENLVRTLVSVGLVEKIGKDEAEEAPAKKAK